MRDSWEIQGNLYNILMEILKEGDHLEDPGPDWRIIMNGILPRIVEWEDGTGFIWLRKRAVAHSFEDGNELSGSIKCGEFLDQPRNC
jgi:hypothetical protein